MSALKAQLQADVIKHLKAGEKEQLMVVRAVLGDIEKREKGGKEPVELTEVEIISVLQKAASSRRDTATIYDGAGAFDRAAKEIFEAEVIEGYLPAGLSEAEVVAIVDKAIAATGATTIRDMGGVMKVVTTAVAGRFDGSAVAGIVKSKLS